MVTYAITGEAELNEGPMGTLCMILQPLWVKNKIYLKIKFLTILGILM